MTGSRYAAVAAVLALCTVLAGCDGGPSAVSPPAGADELATIESMIGGLEGEVAGP